LTIRCRFGGYERVTERTSSWAGQDGFIAVDWGTTNRRAYLLTAEGGQGDSFEDDLGLMGVPRGGFPAAVAGIRERLGDRPMLLAGMVGSNRGWREAPYVPAPAGGEDLARAILWVEPGRTGIVPGVSQSGAAGADVMRGEEVQVVGAVAAGLVPRDATICHPGTHAKWIEVEGGRIASFRTMMTGELFSLIKKHSILADQLDGEDHDGASFREGVAEGLGGASPVARLFGVRARHLLGEYQGEPASYVSGLLIGCDVRAALALRRGADPVLLLGRPELCTLYAVALGEAGVETRTADGAEAFLGGIKLLTEML